MARKIRTWQEDLTGGAISLAATLRPKQPAGSEACRSINFSGSPGAAQAKYFACGIDECAQLGRLGNVSREVEEQARFIDAARRSKV